MSTAPIHRMHYCGCHGALECPDRDAPSSIIGGFVLAAISGALMGCLITLLIVSLF